MYLIESFLKNSNFTEILPASWPSSLHKTALTKTSVHEHMINERTFYELNILTWTTSVAFALIAGMCHTRFRISLQIVTCSALGENHKWNGKGDVLM